MNDFTKDELNLLIHFIGLTTKQDGLDLAVKIQSMINNYREHESEIDIGEAPMICKKCGKVTG